MNGDGAFTLARWFAGSSDIIGPEHKFRREELLNEVHSADAVGVAGDGKTVAARCPSGVCIMERATIKGCPVVVFDFAQDGRWARERFFMNASSVEGLGRELRQLPRVPFDRLFVHGR